MGVEAKGALQIVQRAVGKSGAKGVEGGVSGGIAACEQELAAIGEAIAIVVDEGEEVFG